MHQTLDSSDVFGYLHGSVSTASEPVTQEGLQPQATGNWEQDISSPGSSSSLLARVSRKRLKMDPAVAHDDDCVMVAMSGNISMGSPISRNSAILLHEFHITEESNVPGRGQRGKKAAAKGKRRHCGPSIASLFFEKGIPEPGGENENWYRGLGQSQGIAALKDALQSANLEEMLSALGPCSEPSGGQWRQLQLPLAATLDVHAGSQPLGWWLVRPDLPSFDSTNSVTARLFISPDEAVKCLTASPDVERRGVEMSPFRQAFEWRVVGGPAIRKRKRKVDRANFKLQIQGNRQDPCANQPPHFQDFPLRKEQLRSLWWMQQQEKTDQVFDLTLCRVRVDPMKPATPIPPGSIRSPQFRELNWQLELARRAFYKVRGGILGDAPGYGKTATTIGLIDSSLAERPTIPSDQQPYFFHSFASLVLVPSNLLDQWVDEIQKFTKHSSASPALSMSRTSGMPLKVLAIKTVAHLKALTVEEICHAAIVICSYRLLYSKVYRARLLELAGTAGLTSGCFERSPETKKSTPDAAALRGPVDLLNLRRNTRRFRENPASLMWDHRQELPCEAPMSEIKDSSQLAFPVLEQIWWKRVVLDEFHELEAIGDTAQFESLQGICAHYRWGLTGTPPTRDLAQVATLAKVFHLGELPRADETCAYSTELAQEMAQHFLDHFARQNTSEEVEPIPLKERIITVDQTAEERAIYLQASRDVADNSGSALSEEDRAERLIKLCSHFAAYCGMAAAASDAGSECHRIISTKEDHAKKTRKEVLQRAVQLELLWQTVGSVGSRSSDQQEILQQLGADPAECAGLMHLTRPMPQVPLPEVGNKQQTPAAQIAETLEEESRQAPKDPASMEPVPPPEEASENSACQVHQETHRNDPAVLNSYSSSASLAAAAFTEASRMSLPQLQRLAGPRFSGHENGQSIATAQGRMVSAAQTALSAQRSVEFFKRTLAAARGDSSADQRSCSICLEEDLKEEQLSITVCAHVFHTDCLKEVVQHFKTCPVCRHSLEGKNKVTPLTLELAPDLRAERGKKRGPGDDTAKKAGSKLVALATHLQGIAPGEKMLVFCQWEDLKKHIAETLQTMGVPHLQLSGSIYQRSDILRRFQDETQDGERVLLLSLEHAASGTNLTAANHVVFGFDASLENATRLFTSVAHDNQELEGTRVHERQRTSEMENFPNHSARPRSISMTSEESRELIDKDQMRKALEQQGFVHLENCTSFHQLWEAIGNEGIDLQSFHAVLRHLKLHLLCGSLELPSAVTGQVGDLPEERGFIGFIDWCPRRIEENYFRRPKRAMDMFLTHRKPHMKMRWVHCARVERPTILRLAVKYQLHPLPVEDTIQLEQQSVPIVRKYNDNFFVVIPLLRLTEEAKRKLSQYKEHRTRRNFEDLKLEDLIDVPQVEQCRFAAFAAGPPHYDTVISFMTEWKVSKLHADNYESEGQTSGRSTSASPEERGGQLSPGRPLMETPLPIPVPTPGGGVQSAMPLRLPSARQDSGEEQDFFAGVVRQIQRDYSMLRSGNSSWVLWRLLDVTVDELSPILSAYRAQLRWFSSLITREEARVSKDVEKRLLRSKVELDWLQRKVRPMVKVVKHIIKDKAIDPDVTRYLEDIEDHLNTFLEEVSRIMGVCHSLRDEVNSYRDRQQQKVLYVLTLVTTLIMPTHLLTGIFGMNWQDADGRPVVPGLGVMEESRGYYLFWGLAFSLTLLIWLTFSRILKWI